MTININVRVGVEEVVENLVCVRQNVYDCIIVRRATSNVIFAAEITFSLLKIGW